METTQQPSIFDKVGGWMTDIAKIVTGGAQIYATTKGQIQAIEDIDKETVKTTTTAAPAASGPVKLPSWVMPVAVAIVVLLAIVIVRKMR